MMIFTQWREGTNEYIHGITGTLAALREVDFERIAAADLKTKVILYLAQDMQKANGLRVRYEGVPVVSNQGIALPMPVYTRRNMPHATDEKFTNGEVPLEVLAGTIPGTIELDISANTKEDYKGINALINQIVPSLMQAGYSHYNPDHLSTSWLHVGRQKADALLFFIEPQGLIIRNPQLSDGTYVFTSHDVTRLLGLR